MPEFEREEPSPQPAVRRAPRTDPAMNARASDDPPARWLASVTDEALRQLDFVLLLDLIRLEGDPVQWCEVAQLVVSEIERRTARGEISNAQQLTTALLRELGPEGREALRASAKSAVAALAGGRFVHHVTLRLREVDDADLELLNRLCHTIGPRLIPSLAQALAIEKNPRAIGRLQELLLRFSTAEWQSVTQLKGLEDVQ